MINGEIKTEKTLTFKSLEVEFKNNSNFLIINF